MPFSTARIAERRGVPVCYLARLFNYLFILFSRLCEAEAARGVCGRLMSSVRG